MKMEKVCRIVSKNEVVIQSGERRGEVVFRLAVADGEGEGTLADIQAKIEPDVYNSLALFVKEYNVVFDYTLKSFNGKAYAAFNIVAVGEPSKAVAEPSKAVAEPSKAVAEPPKAKAN